MRALVGHMWKREGLFSNRSVLLPRLLKKRWKARHIDLVWFVLHS